MTRWGPRSTSSPRTCIFEPGFFFFSYTQFPQAYTSYAGNAGTWFRHSRTRPSWPRAMACSSAISAVRIADITDGTSNTIAHGEHAVGLLTDDTDRIANGPAWACGWYGDTLFTSFYPINPAGKVQNVYGDDLTEAYIGAASSFHPGGANFAFADGSVKFIKDTIDSWPMDSQTATPLGVTQSSPPRSDRIPTGCTSSHRGPTSTSIRRSRPATAARSSPAGAIERCVGGAPAGWGKPRKAA